MSVSPKTPIYDYPANATLARTTWFEQWTLAIKPDFDSKVNVAMRRTNMRLNIIELIHEAKKVRLILVIAAKNLLRIVPGTTCTLK